MALNDGQLDDLDGANTIIDNDTVKAPSEIPQTKEPITIIPENDQLRDKAVALHESFEEKLPMMDVTFKLVDGNHTTLVDLEDVEETISGECAIGQEDADVVEATFGGLYNKTLTKNHFTANPSMVNFGAVQLHMRNRIGLEEAALATNFNTLIDKPIEDAKCILNELKENYLPYLYLKVRYLQIQNSEIATQLALSDYRYHETQPGVFTNLLKVDLTTVPENKLQIGGELAFDNLLEASSILFKDARLKSLVLAIGSEKTLTESQSPDAILEHSTQAVTIKDLLDFYSKAGVSEYVDQLTNEAEEMIKKLEKIQEDGRGLVDDAHGVRSYLTDNIKTITEASQYHQGVVKCIMNMIQLNYISEEYFSFLTGK